MHTTLHRILGFGVIAAVSVLAVTPPAWSDDRHDRDRRERGRDFKHDGRDRSHERREWKERQEAERRHWKDRREAERRHLEWQRREWEHRRHLDQHRAAALWRFERDRGWRWQHRPGLWSPFVVWWAIDGRPLLRPHPTARIVRYPTGYYELVGDGITVPFYWVWRPTVVVAVPPPVPLPPPMPHEYPVPPDAVYPPPPPLPSG